MKTSRDPRHKRRKKIIQELFTQSFLKQQAPSQKVVEIIRGKDQIDETIHKIAPEFPIDKINKTDLAILRLAVYELEVERKVPPKVVIDEAIELAKEFGGETSPGFINGALGKLLAELQGKNNAATKI